MFKIGDKVVCVKTSQSGTTKEREIYTIIGFRDDGVEGLFFKEVINRIPLVFYGHNPSRFRKLDDTFATETLERITEEIEEEYLILR